VFGNLKQLCGLTDGNLSRHLLVLEEAHLIEITKRTALGRTQTVCRLTSAGRRRFLAYLGVLEQVLADAVRGPRGLAPEDLAGARR
jgi:predicted ArsR family transcriptional regulator